MNTFPVELDYDEIKEFCEDYGIRRMALFGSVLTDSFNSDSDIDFLLEYEDENPKPIYQCYVREELREITGRQVDVVTVQALEGSKYSAHFKDEILETAVDLYVN